MSTCNHDWNVSSVHLSPLWPDPALPWPFDVQSSDNMTVWAEQEFMITRGCLLFLFYWNTMWMVCSMSVKTRDAKSQKINNANIFRPDNGHVHNGHVHNVNWVGIKYVKIIVVKKKQEDMNKRWMEQFQLSQILAGCQYIIKTIWLKLKVPK